MKHMIPYLPYPHFCNFLMELQEQGVIHLRGNPSRNVYNNFDISILRLFGYNIPYSDNEYALGPDEYALGPEETAFVKTQIASLMAKINTGEIDIAWLDSPHVAALLKAKIARNSARKKRMTDDDQSDDRAPIW